MYKYTYVLELYLMQSCKSNNSIISSICAWLTQLTDYKPMKKMGKILPQFA